jgi:hypothetical protein
MVGIGIAFADADHTKPALAYEFSTKHLGTVGAAWIEPPGISMRSSRAR